MSVRCHKLGTLGLSLAALHLLLLSVTADGQTCQAAAATAAASGETDAAAVQQAGLLQQGLTINDLPATRPNQPWPYRQLSTAMRAPKPTTNSSSGVTYVMVQHAPLANISVNHLVWWFSQNLERKVRYVDGKRYSLYLIWHPRDHCHQKVVARAPGTGAQGDTWLLQEFMMASKNFTSASSAGFDAQSEAQINLQLTVQTLSRANLTLVFQPPGFAYPFTMLTHTWSNVPGGGGIAVTSRLWVGHEKLSTQLNKVVNCNFFSRGDEPLVTALKWQSHAVEEFGNFEKILPDLYAKRNRL